MTHFKWLRRFLAAVDRMLHSGIEPASTGPRSSALAATVASISERPAPASGPPAKEINAVSQQDCLLIYQKGLTNPKCKKEP